MRLSATLGTLLAIAIGLTAAPPAGGADRDPADVASAREFSFAAYRLRVAVKAAGPEMARRKKELSDCSSVYTEAPRRAKKAALEVYFAADLLVLLDGIRQPLAVFVAELDRVPVEDAALRRGRAAWRGNATDLAAIAPVPADVCDQFARWQAAGYTDATRPAVDTKGFRRLGEDDKTSNRRARRLRAAVRRMRELGVRRGTAERFAGDTLLEGIPELEVEVIE